MDNFAKLISSPFIIRLYTANFKIKLHIYNIALDRQI